MKQIFIRYGVFCFLFFFSSVLYAQSINIDSLKKELSVAKHDSTKFKILQALRVTYTFSYPDSALFYAEQQLQLARKLMDRKLEVVALDSKGWVLSVMGNYPDAMTYLLRALNLSEQIRYDEWTFRIYSHLTDTNIDQGNFDQAIQYGFKSLEIAEKTSEREYKLSALGHIGSIYEKLNLLDSALFYIQRSYNIEWQLKGKHEWNTLPFLLGNIYAKKADYHTAINYYRSAIGLAINRNNIKAVMNIYNGLANVYKASGSLDSSIYYAGKTIEIGNKIVNPLAILEASKLLANLYMVQHQKDSVIKYMELGAAFRDSLFNREKIIHAQNIAFKAQLRRREIKSEKAALRNKMKMYILAGGLGGLLVIAFILYRNNEQKQKAYTLLQKQKEKTDQALEELKTTQTQLVQREKMASLGELTAGIAHEIQNPLNFVNNFSEVNMELILDLEAELQTGHTAEAKTIASDIYENERKIHQHGKRADAIVKNMLEHSRKAGGEKQPTNINELTEEYLHISYHSMRVKDNSFNATLQTDFDHSIGKVNVVQQDFSRVLLNLFNNAFYSVTEKKKQQGNNYEPVVFVRTRKTGKEIEISVQDNGLGIEEKLVSKIFQPFFTTKPAGEGTGLGLSLSYDIITKEHRGDLKVETKEGEGAKFSIHLPISSS